MIVRHLLILEPLHRPVPLLMSRADTVKIVYAQRINRTSQNGQPVQELIGSVRLLQGITRLSADKVTRFLERDEILLEGRVLIVEETDSVLADRVRYDSASKIGYATGNVNITDGEVDVFAPSAIYFTNEKRALFEETVELIDSMTVLTSLFGEYFTEDKRAEFHGDVVLEEDRTYLEADSVTYYRESEISEGYGNVFVERSGGEGIADQDSTTRTFLFGEYTYNDNQQGYSRIEENAFLFQVRRDSSGSYTDSLLIEAHQLESIRLDSLRRLVAVDSVRIWQDDFSAVADSAVYDRIFVAGDSTVEENRLYQQPVAWFAEYQLLGDTLIASAVEGQIDTLFAFPRAFVAYQDSATGRINQLKGDHLLGLFVQDSLKSLRTGPQAESIYFRTTEGGQVGATKTSGDQILLHFKRNKLNSINVYSGIQGEHYDGALIPEPFELAGFKWLQDSKPVKNDMMGDEQRNERITKRLQHRLYVPAASMRFSEDSINAPSPSHD